MRSREIACGVSQMQWWNDRFLSLWGCLLLVPILGGAQDSQSYQLQRILGQYTELFGGMRDTVGLSAVIIEGSIELDGRAMQFVMHRKRPNMLRYRLFLNQSSITSGFDGRIGWIRKEAQGVVKIERASGAVLASLKQQGRFESPLFEHERKDDYRLRLLSQQYWEGRSVQVIEVTDPWNEVWLYFLDARTVHLLRVDRLDASRAVVSQTLYRDYREVEGFPFAHEVEERVRGNTVSVATIKTITVNPGLLSFYFREPKR